MTRDLVNDNEYKWSFDMITFNKQKRRRDDFFRIFLQIRSKQRILEWKTGNHFGVFALRNANTKESLCKNLQKFRLRRTEIK